MRIQTTAHQALALRIPTGYVEEYLIEQFKSDIFTSDMTLLAVLYEAAISTSSLDRPMITLQPNTVTVMRFALYANKAVEIRFKDNGLAFMLCQFCGLSDEGLVIFFPTRATDLTADFRFSAMFGTAGLYYSIYQFPQFRQIENKIVVDNSDPVPVEVLNSPAVSIIGTLPVEVTNSPSVSISGTVNVDVNSLPFVVIDPTTLPLRVGSHL